MEVGPRSDVYSLGAILSHLLAGRMPYAKKGARVPAATVLQWVLEGPPEPLQKCAPGAPRELVAVCEKAMQRDAARR